MTPYQQQLHAKLALLEARFADVDHPPIEVFPSASQHFRMRVELRVWHDDGQACWAMHALDEDGQPQRLAQFPIASRRINELMPPLLAAINASETLRRKLFTVEFLTTTSDQALVSMIYHRRLDDQWQIEAEALAETLTIDLIGRSRKQRVVIGRDHVVETLTVDGRVLDYQQVETGFTQPNAGINQQMLEWARKQCSEPHRDLLELYCGNGNFTIALADRFRRVLATEVAKVSIKSALHNLTLNNVTNIDLVRLSAEELSQAIAGVRPFRRLAHLDLARYDFSTILVDPPRAGLDDLTRSMVARYPRILYVSCNPETLSDDLQLIGESHRITQFAAFDQFPWTPHLECAVLLQRR
ncbi:tRNA (uridine(54)-C5)-methyltransferase TrmA [Gammaproteobacteria bacterium]|nr:tRNA (uridine(54)-C5)-methyltransferase TrmA [Gammaproteobacteria bacterium]